MLLGIVIHLPYFYRDFKRFLRTDSPLSYRDIARSEDDVMQFVYEIALRKIVSLHLCYGLTSCDKEPMYTFLKTSKFQLRLGWS